MEGSKKNNKIINLIFSNSGIVAERSTHIPMMEGSNPDTDTSR
jgi:hypothetical protein